MQTDLSDEALLELMTAQPNYMAPDLYDAELDQLITERGREAARARKEIAVWAVIVVVMLSVITGFAAAFTNGQIAYQVLCFIYLAYFAIGYIGGMYRAKQVTNSYKSGRHDLTAKLLPGAVWWNSLWYPWTVQHLLKCQQIELELLLSESRVLELEAHSRFIMALFNPTKLKKSRYITRLQNNLWLSNMFAGRYREAADGFNSCDLNKIEKMMRPVLLNNLAFCQVKSGDPRAAQETLSRAFAEIANQKQSKVRPNLTYIQALACLEQNDLPGTEAALEKAKSLAEKLNGSELKAACMVIEGKLLCKQQRYDESAMFFKSAIEIFSSTDNPHFLNLCYAMHYYAQMLLESGNQKSALSIARKIMEYVASYQQREENTYERLKQRLRDSSKIRTASDLLTTSHREPLIELGTLNISDH
jgi:tetratricopeptide (TPR) repeat protein